MQHVDVSLFIAAVTQNYVHDDSESDPYGTLPYVYRRITILVVQ
jgi:hypothetical protein